MKSAWLRRLVIEYVTAVLLVAAAAILTWLLRRTFPATPNALFFCAVILIAWFGGFGPAFLASVLSCIMIYFLPLPLFISMGAGGMILRFLMFLVVGLFMGWISSRQRQIQTALRQAHEELEKRVEERTRELTAANEALKVECAERQRAENALRESEARLEEAQRVAHIGHWERDAATDQIICSSEFLRIFGLDSRPIPLRLSEIQQLIHPDDRPLQRQALAEAQQGLRRYNIEYRIIRPNGEERIIHSMGEVKRDDSGRAVTVFGTVQDITERKRAEMLLEGERKVLEMIAANAPLSESLTALMRLIELYAPGMVGSILLLDKKGVHLHHGAAPDLPPEYIAAIDGRPIGPNTGSCGTAAYTKKAAFVEDIATDPRWKEYRDIALPHGLRACWSTPVFDEQCRVVGTFAMYYHQPALPGPEHLRLIDTTTHIAAIAICRHRDRADLQESEAKLKEAQRIAKMGYWDRDLVTGRITWSEETWHIFGLQPQDRTLSQEELAQKIYPEDRPLQAEALARVMQKGQPYDVEYRIVLPDGEVRFIHVMDEIVRDKSGRPIRVFGIVQDITERKRAEERLQAQDQEIRAIVEHSPDHIVRIDRELRRIYINPAFIKVYEAPKEALLGGKIGSAVESGAVKATEEEIESIRKSVKHVFDTGRPLDFETTWPLPIIGRRFYAVHLEPEFDAHGVLASVLSIARDITERKRMEEALKESETKYRTFFQSSSDIIVFSDREGNILNINPRGEQLTGYPESDLCKMNIFQHLIVPEDQPLMHEVVKDLFEGRPRTYEERWKTREGKIIYLEGLSVARRSPDGNFLSTFCTLRDITGRKQAEQSLRENQQLLRQVLATLPVGVSVVDPRGNVVLSNTAFKRIWGDVIVIGHERWGQSKGFWHDTGKGIAPTEWASVRALSAGQTSLNELLDIETFDAQHKTIQNSAAPVRDAEGQIVGAVIVNEDVTERVRAEEALHQTQAELTRVARVTMMGELTASIAHEINQPLAAVVTSADAAARWLAAVPPNLEEARRAVQRIARDGNRASEVIKRVRALMKKGEPVKTPFNINELIQETVALTQPEFVRKKVTLQTELSPELPHVPADRIQLQQVLLNLVVNALDSMGTVTQRQRVLRIRTARPEPDAIHVTVQDTGTGIGPMETEQIFEPFYTTKSEGLGMGLAISRSIVEAHGGRLWATPNDGPGATFQFTLPIQEDSGS